VTRPIPPVVDRGNQWFWDGVAEHRLLIQRCASCGTLRHPAGPMCGRCQSLDWDVQEAAGGGTVVTWIVSRHPSDPEAEPRTVVLVDLDEGVRIMSNTTTNDVAIGDRVTITWEPLEDGRHLWLFEKS
jgi:uncharacterized OB-fold protein